MSPRHPINAASPNPCIHDPVILTLSDSRTGNGSQYSTNATPNPSTHHSKPVILTLSDSRTGNEPLYFARAAINPYLVLTLLLALLGSPSLKATPVIHQLTPQTTSSLETLPATLQAQTSPLRQTLTTHLASPDTALTLIAAGFLLLLAECNLPGAILPGALGLLLLLSGVFGLSLHPIRPPALIVLLLSSAALAISARLPLFGIPALLGTAGLALSLSTLTTPAPHTSVATAVALSIGLATSLLGRIAWIARRNKAHLAPLSYSLTHPPRRVD